MEPYCLSLTLIPLNFRVGNDMAGNRRKAANEQK